MDIFHCDRIGSLIGEMDADLKGLTRNGRLECIRRTSAITSASLLSAVRNYRLDAEAKGLGEGSVELNSFNVEFVQHVIASVFR